MNATRHLVFLCAAASLTAQTPATDTTAPAPAPTPAATEVPAESARLADTEDKLSTALRSFSLMQKENDRLVADTRRLTDVNTSLTAQLAEARAQITALQEQLATVSATAAQVEILRTQLRQTQDQINALTAENTELRTRLAITSAPPGSALGVPTRPGSAAVAASPAAPAAPAVADLQTPETRFHTVVEGDTLSKIARQYYGDSKRWPEILEANRDQLADERSMRFGIKLRIP
jgi:nucleoid-associated protein YgaU